MMVILMLRVIILTPDQFCVEGLTHQVMLFLEKSNITLNSFFPLSVTDDNINIIYPEMKVRHGPVSMYSLSPSLVLIVDIPETTDLKLLKGLSQGFRENTIRGLSAQTRKSFSVVHTFDSVDEDKQFISEILDVVLDELPSREIAFGSLLALLPVYTLSREKQFSATDALEKMISVIRYGIGSDLIANNSKAGSWFKEIEQLYQQLLNENQPEQVFQKLRNIKNMSVPLTELHIHICALELLNVER